MFSNTSELDQPGTCLGFQGSQQALQGDARLAIGPDTGISWEEGDRKAGSWFVNQVEPYEKRLRKPHKKD